MQAQKAMTTEKKKKSNNNATENPTASYSSEPSGDTPWSDPIFWLAIILVVFLVIDILLILNGSCLSRVLGFGDNCGY
jgi:hypothetical protein